MRSPRGEVPDDRNEAEEPVKHVVEGRPLGEGAKGALALAVLVTVVAVGGMAATTLQERAEARASEAEARAAVASAREEVLASERRAEGFLLRSAMPS